MLKLTDEKVTDLILPKQMNDGQIAVIKTKDEDNDYIGVVVQRYNNTLFSLGGNHQQSWPAIEQPEFLVEVLPNGTQLTIINNE